MIRKFIKNDIDQVMSIWLQTNLKTHSYIEEKYWNQNYDIVKKLIPKAKVFVFIDKSEIVGFIGVAKNYVAGIFVKKQFQSIGVGSQLLDYVFKKYNNLKLKVYNKNQKAINFYLRHGFEIIEEYVDEETLEKEIEMQWKKKKSK
ncbi:N-acetyltransferase [Spiroplasma alleghenense]|uniref:N-acetyltransferase domain-containing protein n=1 Tax=Spiroplasma alleghenense TaxID=216931 RepID=A0A345Z286_9MOLU|nr:N-acetyltransferase [Spiroplasma alleghenense]AXK50715.1 hypothetical protein SALLE_v1c00390 [Spiroplasma alleghenense]